MKKMIFTILIFIIVFLIYFFNINTKVYYVSIGDQISYGINNLGKVQNNYADNIKKKYGNNLLKYINYSNIEDYRVMDLINDINYNKEYIYKKKKYKLQNTLIKSNHMIISIGMNDIINKNKLSYNYIDELLINIEQLFILLRKYNKDRIDYLSFYNSINNKELITYTNNRLKKLCKKYKINYIDISKLNNYMVNNNPNNNGYLYITNKILNFTK